MKIVKILCVKCRNNVIREEERKTLRKEKIIGRTNCDECNKKNYEDMLKRERSDERTKANSSWMKTNNPMFDPRTRAKVASTKSGEEKDVDDYLICKKDLKKETLEDTRHRMRINNPMFNADTREQVTRTFNKRIKDGLITYKRGPDHHLWKGNRDFANACRSQLYKAWIYPILERDEFKCVRCDSKKDLQVHHLYPLRTILEEIKKDYAIEDLSKISTTDNFHIIQDVVGRHTLDMGVTLCASCHCKEDSRIKHKK